MHPTLPLLLMLASAPALDGGSSAPPGPQFVEDDFAQALAQAKASRRPLFVDAWAPW